MVKASDYYSDSFGSTGSIPVGVEIPFWLLFALLLPGFFLRARPKPESVWNLEGVDHGCLVSIQSCLVAYCATWFM